MEATRFEYDGLRYIGSFAPLFVHQYSQAWFDFRGKRDKYADYLKIQPSRRKRIAVFALGWQNDFPTTAMTCGESRRRTRKMDT